jgi:hypothetical protein
MHPSSIVQNLSIPTGLAAQYHGRDRLIERESDPASRFTGPDFAIFVPCARRPDSAEVTIGLRDGSTRLTVNPGSILMRGLNSPAPRVAGMSNVRVPPLLQAARHRAAKNQPANSQSPHSGQVSPTGRFRFRHCSTHPCGSIPVRIRGRPPPTGGRSRAQSPAGSKDAAKQNGWIAPGSVRLMPAKPIRDESRATPYNLKRRMTR